MLGGVNIRETQIYILKDLKKLKTEKNQGLSSLNWEGGVITLYRRGWGVKISLLLASAHTVLSLVNSSIQLAQQTIKLDRNNQNAK